jgi:DNA-binding GntR family transcriptional regulator
MTDQDRANLSPLFEPQTVTSLRDRTYEAIRDAILSGQLKPGHRLKERDLAAQMQISTTPIKEALRMLQQEGLVVSLPRRGVAVSNLASVPILEIAAIRAALEGVACRLVAEKATDDQIADLHSQVELMESLTKPLKIQDLIKANTDFHNKIYAMANNPYLSTMLETVRAPDRHFRHKALAKPGEVHTGFLEHKAVLEAIRARDGDSAERCMKDHILRTARNVLSQDSAKSKQRS